MVLLVLRKSKINHKSIKQLEREKLRRKWKPIILQRQGFKCKLCSRTEPDWRGWHLSHIKSLAQGGKDEESNFEVICAKCHAEKRHHLKEV